MMRTLSLRTLSTLMLKSSSYPTGDTRAFHWSAGHTIAVSLCLLETIKYVGMQRQSWSSTPFFPSRDNQAEPHFRNNLPSASSKDGEDKEPKVHIEHFFDIDSLENAEYAIKAYLMYYGIHHFFEDPMVVVPELISEFWRTTKVYSNEVINGYFIGKVRGIPMKLMAEMIA
ncbi:hypothetical protein JHK85_040940 [Glycine max]|nr:hypothetical protein JHK85_040940 [Glycine max]